MEIHNLPSAPSNTKSIRQRIKYNLKELLLYLRKPTDSIDVDADLRDKLVLLPMLLIIVFVSNYFFIELNDYLQYNNLVDFSKHSTTARYQSESFWLIMFRSGIIAPVAEEIIFRLPIRFRFNPITAFLRGKWRDVARHWWDRMYPIIFYSVAIVFGLIHLIMYDFDSTSLWIAPLLVLSQILGGIVLGFLCVRHGFIWAVIFHIIYNCISIAT